MRSTRTRIVLTCVVAAISIPVVVAPTAMAASPATTKTQERHQNRSLHNKSVAIVKANNAIRGIRNSAGSLAVALGATNSILGTTNVDVSTLKTLAAGLPPILTQLGDGLTKVGAGLTAINAALIDPTTGLVGLNNARPQFGAFLATGVLIDGTGAHPPAKGPSGNATRLSAGTYIVHFGNDVAARFMTLTSFPTGVAPVAGSFANCSVTPTPPACTAASTTSPDDVFVLWQATTTAAPTDPANGWEVMATSG